jgi:hypothetical protein
MQRLVTKLLLFFLAVHIAAPAKHMFSIEEGTAYVECANISHILKSSVVSKRTTPNHSVKNNAAGRCCSHRHILLTQSALSDESETEVQPQLLSGTGDLLNISIMQDTSTTSRQILGVLKNPSIKQLSTAMLRTTVLLI